jgi:hypothetical protein
MPKTMPRGIHVKRINHMNVVLEDFDASVEHWRDLFGAEFALDIPLNEWRACLMGMGGGLFEFFVPHEFMLNTRYGPHWLGIEYNADMDEVRASIADHGLRIARDIGVAVHTHPDDSFGVSFEFYGEAFNEREWPVLGRKLLPPEYWRLEHPLGMTGLKAYTVGVRDIGAAAAFIKSFFATEPVYEVDRPAVAARAIGFSVGGVAIELVTPTGDGILIDHLNRFGEGIRSTVMSVADVEKARAYFRSRGIEPVQGTASNAIAVPASANRGVIIEFGD